MSNASHQPTEVCTHERRPGTTVCLHCRHEARLAARARRKRLLLRGSAVGVVLAVLGAAGMLSADALRGRGANRNQPKQTRATSDSAAAAKVIADAPQTSAPPAASTTSAASTANPSSTPVAQQGDVARRMGAPLAPIIAMGQSSLGDGIVAVRDDSSVVLAFDTPETRTRIPEKFERFVRATLPRIYGPAADSALAKIAAGGMVSDQKTLLYELPTRGVRIALRDGWWMVLYPEIRPGQDGPLVIRYRAAVVDRPN